MAGSFNHVVKADGSLSIPAQVQGRLDCVSGDVYEAVEQMYGMIWYLADKLETHDVGWGNRMASEIIEEARRNYEDGLAASPTPRFKKED